MVVETIRIVKGLSIASPWPALFIEKENVLIFSDLHLGLEDEQESKGIHIPTSVFPKIMESILTPAKELSCDKIVILGDFKHEFGKPSEAEWYSVKKIIRSLREIGVEPSIVRGNHDNYIILILKEMNVKLFQPSLQINNFTLFHGHLEFTEKEEKAKHIIIGHEHPSITIRDDLGVKHRFKAFLTGKIGNKSLTVLPSTSPLAYGSNINETLQKDLLSPILQKIPLDDFIPYAIEIGVAVKRFPRLRFL
ncbi:MAG: metallophosphoesterase [Nitrososphaerales archaeon]